MPRKAKPSPPSVRPLPQVEAGQAYGVAGEQQAALNEMPMAVAPGITTGGVGPGPAPGGPPPAPGGAPPPPDPNMMADQSMGLPPGATAGALGIAPPSGGLDAPTGRPDEPITAGLPFGPGAGPEALTLLNRSTRPTPVATVLTKLAAANNGNPLLAQMAREAQSRGV